MSDDFLADLEVELRRAAERREAQQPASVPGRRVRRILPAALLMAGAAAAAAFVVAVAGSPPPDDEVPAGKLTPPAKAVPLSEIYGVFKRPRTAADRLPKLVNYRRVNGDTIVDTARSRLVARLGGHRAFVAPATTRGEPGLCTFEVLAGGGGGTGCGGLAGASAQATRRPKRTTIATRGGTLYWWLVPDGTRRVRFELRDGTIVWRQVKDNAVMLVPEAPIRRVTWIDADGRRYSG